MDLVTARAEDVPDLVALWNVCIGEHLPLRERLLEQQWKSVHHDPKLVLLAKEGNALLGAVAGKAPSAPWSDPARGYLSHLMVHPEARRRGTGTALYQALVEQLRRRGRTHLSVGGDPAHLLPGVPVGVGLEAWAFLRRQGLNFRGIDVDLHLDLNPLLPAPNLAPGFNVGQAQRDAVLAFVERVFPGRWLEEVEGYHRAGAPILTLEESGRVLGFSAVFLPDAPYLGPSQFWSPTLKGKVAGLGPMGIDPSLRGQGQGLALFTAAAQWLKSQGAEHLLVDWTTLAGFYGRLGAHVWRSYQHADGALKSR